MANKPTQTELRAINIKNPIRMNRASNSLTAAFSPSSVMHSVHHNNEYTAQRGKNCDFLAGRVGYCTGVAICVDDNRRCLLLLHKG